MVPLVEAITLIRYTIYVTREAGNKAEEWFDTIDVPPTE
jgi:hypothetical protein